MLVEGFKFLKIFFAFHLSLGYIKTNVLITERLAELQNSLLPLCLVMKGNI